MLKTTNKQEQKQARLALAQYSQTLTEEEREQARQALVNFRESEKGERFNFFLAKEDSRREPDLYGEPEAPASECLRTFEELELELLRLEEACR